MRRLVHSLIDRPMSRQLLRRTVARLPRRPVSSAEPLAIRGGRPVRDIRLRPWPRIADTNLFTWQTSIRSAFRRIYLAQTEGLPQPLGRQFAETWAEFCGTKFGLLVGHGTDALRIGLAAALDHDGLDYGGEIIVPNFSFIASATAALDRRIGVALVDVDPGTLLLDPDKVEQAIVAGRTRAIMPVHLFGQPTDMTRLQAIAQKHDLKLIEDAAQAHGAMWSGRRVGAWGDVGAFSFQSFKTLSSGEGGALVTSDEAIYERAYGMHNVGRSASRHSRWTHETLGWNCRMTEYQAALLIDRFKRLDGQQRVRAGNYQYLRKRLRAVPVVEVLAVRPEVDAHAMYMFVMRYKSDVCGGVDIDRFIAAVSAEGVPLVRGFTTTLAGQPVIRSLAARRSEYIRVLDTPVADAAARDTMYVPHEAFLGSTRDMDDIADAIEKVMQNFQRDPAVAGSASAGKA